MQKIKHFPSRLIANNLIQHNFQLLIALYYANLPINLDVRENTRLFHYVTCFKRSHLTRPFTALRFMMHGTLSQSFSTTKDFAKIDRNYRAYLLYLASAAATLLVLLVHLMLISLTLTTVANLVLDYMLPSDDLLPSAILVENSPTSSYVQFHLTLLLSLSSTLHPPSWFHLISIDCSTP